MAESLAEKLKRIAREKAAAKAAEVVVVVDAVIAAPVDTAVDTVVANDQPKVEEVKEEVSDVQSTAVVDGTGSGGNTGTILDDSQPNTGSEASHTGKEVGHTGGLGDSTDFGNAMGNSDSTLSIQPTPSNHPLAMQFAEMEQALLTADPTFKTILRDVHRHLGKDPALVTLMTEEEVALVVKGLVVFVNAEVVEPAKAKAVKAGVAAAKKKVISADDL